MADSFEAKPLDERLALMLYALNRRADQGASERTAHAIAGEQLSLTKIKLLHILSRPHQRPPRITRVGAMLGVQSSAATKIVSELDRARLVDRVDDEDDARVKRVVITPKGRDTLDRLDRAHVGSARLFLRELPRDQAEQLEQALTPIFERPDVAQFAADAKP